MDHAHVFLQDLAVVLCTAAVTTVLFQRLRQPVVLGYLLAGVVVGPFVGPSPIQELDTIRTLSEIGVILLLFSLGLEFSIRKLMRLGPTVALVAAVEISLMLILGYLAGQLLGWSTLDSMVAGGLVAISSTMIIAKVFDEVRPEGRLADLVFGVLVMEDLVAIVLIALVAAAGTGGDVTAATLAGTLVRLAFFLTVMLAVGMLVVPRVMRAVVRLRRPETTVVASVGLSFAAALAALAAGYSVALGAFIAGSLVAESGTSRDVERLVRPVRDIFAAIFFVSVGMLIDPAVLSTTWHAVLVLVLVVLVGKVVGVSIGAFLTGHGVRLSVRGGMSLAQIGEFSFIIAALGVQLDLVSDFLYPVAVAVSVVTAFTTPLFIRRSEPFALWVDRKLPRPMQTVASLYGSWIEDVRHSRQADRPWSDVRRRVRLLLLDAALLGTLVVATALYLPRLAEVVTALSGIAAPYAGWIVLAGAVLLAVPFLLGVVGLARRLGMSIAEHALPRPPVGRVDTAAAPRRVLVLTLQIAIVLGVGLPLVALTQPFLPPYRGLAVALGGLALLGFAFWRSASNLQGHMRAGAQVVVEALVARPGRTERTALEEVHALLPGMGTLVPARLEPGCTAIGRSLGELNLRGRTGATAVALLRGEERIVFPTAREVLQAGDLVALTGAQRAITAAVRVLAERPEGNSDAAQAVGTAET